MFHEFQVFRCPRYRCPAAGSAALGALAARPACVVWLAPTGLHAARRRTAPSKQCRPGCGCCVQLCARRQPVPRTRPWPARWCRGAATGMWTVAAACRGWSAPRCNAKAACCGRTPRAWKGGRTRRPNWQPPRSNWRRTTACPGPGWTRAATPKPPRPCRQRRRRAAAPMTDCAVVYPRQSCCRLGLLQAWLAQVHGPTPASCPILKGRCLSPWMR